MLVTSPRGFLLLRMAPDRRTFDLVVRHAR